MREALGGLTTRGKLFLAAAAGATRTVAQLRLGASPRASNALAVAAQACAAFEGRPFVTADDVKAMARPVLAHRLLLTPEAAIQGYTAQAIVECGVVIEDRNAVSGEPHIRFDGTDARIQGGLERG